MTYLSLPPTLRNLLIGSPLEAPTLEVAEAAGKILDANDLRFFPAYTDHGTHHVSRVLDAVVLLIPAEVLSAGLLSDVDASVLICSALFHDLALHIQDRGFVQLVSGETDHQPLPWFDRDQVNRPADLPWPTLWAHFQGEAQHFGTSQLELMLGPVGDRVPRVAYEKRLSPEVWTEGDRLLIGEFLRRHHGRLGHEIAMAGFPGSTPGTFPVLAEASLGLANAIGVTARSHQEPLRRMLDYLTYWEPGSKRPAGAFLPYDMALLRVADYFQIDADRAPPLLLRLKAPLSPRSIEQWEQHQAISAISSNHDDPLAIYVAVSPGHGLRTHLALKALFDDMQLELDTATAVLSEQYARDELSQLRLTKQRIRTNLDSPSLHAQLPYVPRRAALRSDTDLFRLVINDLYGNRPAVAGRELVQNAVDAVRARRNYEARTSRRISPGEMREIEADVVVSLEKRESQLILRISDRGIGMSPETLIDSYLQAGASFRPTAAERAKEGFPGAEQLRTGRFGIGAFAGFLLGPEIKVTTRHPEAEKGVSFVARIDEDLVRIDWVDALIGTEVEIPFEPDAILSRASGDDPQISTFLEQIAAFYRLADPEVAFIDRTTSGESSLVASPADQPGPGEELTRLWRRVECEGFDDVTWYPQTGDTGRLSHNGVLIQDPAFTAVPAYGWSDPRLQAFLNRPPVSVFDSRHALGINLQRYGLTEEHLPFERQLLESIGSDFVAHAFALGSVRHPLQARLGDSPIYSQLGWMPPWPPLLRQYRAGPILVHWLFPFFLPDTYASAILTKGPALWETFPHRMRVMLDPTISPTVNSLEKALQAIARNADRWADLFGAKEVASLVAPGGGAQEFAQLRRGKEFDSVREEWRTVDTGRRGNEHHAYVRKSESNDPRLQVALSAISSDFLSDGRWPVAGFSVFETSGTDEGPLNHLAAAWMEALEGDLSRDRMIAADARNRALAATPALRSLVSTWESAGGTIGLPGHLDLA